MDNDVCALDEDCCNGSCELHPDLIWRCGSVVPPVLYSPRGTYARQYDAADACTIPPDRSNWGDFRWTATIPTGTGLRFELRSSDTAAGLATATAVVIDASMSTPPVDVGPLMVAAGQSGDAQFFEVTAVLYASSDLLTSPILEGFELEFTCVTNE
jgi:hypothetical protein